jgi:hypothetical protein
MLEQLKNIGKLLTSKRVLTGAGSAIVLAFLKTPLAMICITVIAVTYLICETVRKS